MGVIALITVPIIKDTIESAREKNFKNSALGLIEAANEYYLNSKLTGDYFEEIEFKVNNGKMISGDKELSFNGKVPVGDSYVKIKANGDVAINITDGEFYAVKDYDEIGASIGTSEDTALLREELAKKITELEKKVDSNKTSILDLTNKENSNNIFLKTYPVGSIYISTSSTNPSAIYGGTWERYGRGKTLVGLNESETEFSEVNKTGGSKELQNHNHTINTTSEYVNLSGYIQFHASELGGLLYNGTGVFSLGQLQSNNYYTAGSLTRYEGAQSSGSFSIDASHSHKINATTSSAGNGESGNLQPYITVYMWKRVS